VPEFIALTLRDVQKLVYHTPTYAERVEFLVSLTGCPQRWAEIWVTHQMPGTEEMKCPGQGDPWPCPFCGKPLRTHAAKQCLNCHRDWHEPPGSLEDS
jgi:hypothetical protein